MLKTLSIAVVVSAVSIACSSAQIASDKAGNYGGVWANGSNGGAGFTVWDLSQNNNDGTTNFAGYFLGDSTQGAGNVNDASGSSFAIYANPSTAFANAIRGFAQGSLQVGQTFSLQMAVNFRNGNKGLAISSGGNELFDFNVGGGGAGDYTYSTNGGSQTSLGLGYQADSVFSISFTQTSTSNIQVSITRTSSGGGTEQALNSNFNVGGQITSFKLYNSGTDNGNNANNLYFNNLQVIPEPSSLALLAGPTLLGALIYIRRRRG